jgi:hypothetical protein
MPQLACGRQAAMIDVGDDRPLGVERRADVAPTSSSYPLCHAESDAAVGCRCALKRHSDALRHQ